MTEIDWIICALLVLSTVVGIMRGVIREVLSIVGWVAGFMLSMVKSPTAFRSIASATFRA